MFGAETDTTVDDGIRYLERAIATRGTNTLTGDGGVQYNISDDENDRQGGLNYENSNTERLGADGTYRSGDGIRTQGDDTQIIPGRMGRRATEVRVGEEEQQGSRNDRWDKELRKSVSSGDSRSVLRNLSKLTLQNTDVKGRTLTDKVKEYFNKTVTKDSNGRLVPFFHGTLSEFDIFMYGDIGFHLGTLEQAQERIKKLKENGKTGKERIIEAYINITNPVYLPVDRMTWDTFIVGHQLLREGIITEEQFNSLQGKEGFNKGGYNSEAASELRRILSEKDYDGIMYNNGFEGDGVSFIAFNQNQIKYVTNEAPTSNPNMKYSIENLTPEQVEEVKKAERLIPIAKSRVSTMGQVEKENTPISRSLDREAMKWVDRFQFLKRFDQAAEKSRGSKAATESQAYSMAMNSLNSDDTIRLIKILKPQFYCGFYL